MTKERFQVEAKYPQPIPKEELTNKLLQVVKLKQEIDADSIGRAKVVITIADQETLMISLLNDTHIGSTATDYDSIEDFIDFNLKNNNAFLIGAGDYAEGIKSQYLETNIATTPLTFQQQIDLAAGLFSPLAAADRILVVNKDFWGHDGWAYSVSTVDAVRVLMDRFEIPYIRNNGGRLELIFGDNQTVEYEIYHNPPKNSSRDPIHGLYSASQGPDESVRADIYAGAHTHETAVGTIIPPDGNKPVYVIQGGAFKGSNPETPDHFGLRISKPATKKAGQGSVITKNPAGGEPLIFPSPSTDHTQTMNDMAEFYNRLEQTGYTKEILERTKAEVETKPDIRFVSSGSKLVIEPYDETPEDKEDRPNLPYKLAPQYKQINLHVVTELPYIIVPIDVMNLGGASEGVKDFKRLIKEFQAFPQVHYVFMGDVLDRDFPGNVDRENILSRYAQLVNWISNPDKNLKPEEIQRRADAILFGGPMRDDRLKKSLSRFDKPLPAGSYMYEHTGIPLISNMSRITYSVGPAGIKMLDKPAYSGVFIDSSKHKSTEKPHYAVLQFYNRRLHNRPSFVMGTDSPGAATVYVQDYSNQETLYPVLINEGGFAKQDSRQGKDSLMSVAEAGQGVILLPGLTKANHMMIASGLRSHLSYLVPSSITYCGAKKLGILDQF